MDYGISIPMERSSIFYLRVTSFRLVMGSSGDFDPSPAQLVNIKLGEFYGATYTYCILNPGVYGFFLPSGSTSGA